MWKWVAVFAAAMTAPAQQGPSIPARGDYRFVQFSIKAGAKREVRNLGGTLSFDGAGGMKFQGRMGLNDGAATAVKGEGTYRYSAEDSSISIVNPAQPSTTLKLRFNQAGDILTGPASEIAENSYDLFVAIRAEGQTSLATLQGDYIGAYLVMTDGAGSGLGSAMVKFSADGAGKLASLSVMGHTAWVDDVNRLEKNEDSTYKLSADGTGAISFAGSSDILSGDREIFVSSNGEVAIGFGAGAGDRDVLIAIRKEPNASSLSFRGMFWLNELQAESDFAYRPEAVRLGCAAGALRADGGGIAGISERSSLAGKGIYLTTVNHAIIGSDGNSMMGAKARPGVTNLGIGVNGNLIVGAQVGTVGELTLDHGIFVGVRAPISGGSGIYLSPQGIVNSTSLAPPTAPVAPGTLITLYGSGFGRTDAKAPAGQAPLELGGVKVTVNNEPAGLLLVSDSQINLQVPLTVKGPTASFQVSSNGKTSNVVQAAVSATSPAVFTATPLSGIGAASATHADSTRITPEKPARPGESITLLVAGLGAVDAQGKVSDSRLRVLFDGRQGDVSSAKLVPGRIGEYSVNVTIPADLATLATNLAVAVGTSDSFTDLVELPFRR